MVDITLIMTYMMALEVIPEVMEVVVSDKSCHFDQKIASI